MTDSTKPHDAEAPRRAACANEGKFAMVVAFAAESAASYYQLLREGETSARQRAKSSGSIHRRFTTMRPSILPSAMRAKMSLMFSSRSHEKCADTAPLPAKASASSRS